MHTKEREHLETLRRTHQRRLQVLERQAAALGVSAPPHLTIDIEDTRAKIAVLEERLTDA